MLGNLGSASVEVDMVLGKIRVAVCIYFTKRRVVEVESRGRDDEVHVSICTILTSLPCFPHLQRLQNIVVLPPVTKEGSGRGAATRIYFSPLTARERTYLSHTQRKLPREEVYQGQRQYH